LGNDIFLFGKGDGQDLIQHSPNDSTPGKLNTLQLKAGVLASEVVIKRWATALLAATVLWKSPLRAPPTRSPSTAFSTATMLPTATTACSRSSSPMAPPGTWPPSSPSSARAQRATTRSGAQWRQT
jgi:hypothetical protein